MQHVNSNTAVYWMMEHYDLLTSNAHQCFCFSAKQHISTTSRQHTVVFWWIVQHIKINVDVSVDNAPHYQMLMDSW